MAKPYGSTPPLSDTNAVKVGTSLAQVWSASKLTGFNDYLAVQITNGSVSAINDCEVWIKAHPDAGWVEITPADWTVPETFFMAILNNPSSIATGASAEMHFDRLSFHSIAIKLASASANSPVIIRHWWH